MKKIIYRVIPQLYFKLLFFMACCFIYVAAYCQRPELCGGYKIDKAALSRALEYEKSNANRLSGSHYLIRVYLHIIRNDDGSDAGATEEQVQSELNELAISYSPANICFIKMGLNYINNSTLNTMHVGDPSSVALLGSYHIPNCINIYYHHEIVGFGGNAYDRTNCSIKTGNLGTFTTSHEVGHCLGLFHTFEQGNGFEDIDGSNGSSTADLIADTPADPYAYLNQSCFPMLTCVYSGTCTDPKGQTNFSPLYYNTMGYWYASCPDYRKQNAVETIGQFNRIYSFLSTDTDLQNCESPDYLTVGPVTQSSGYLITSAVNSLTTSGSVNLNGTAIITLGGQVVFLENGFKATPSNGGLVSIESSSCNFTLNKIFANNSLTADSHSTQFLPDVKLVIYPNPASSKIHIAFVIHKNEKNVSLQVLDINARKVKEMNLGNLFAGKQNIIVDLSNLSSGIYNINIHLSTERLSTKVVVVQ